MSDSKSLTNPPNGGKVRPWEAVGMSRATWYRKGKPEPRPPDPELDELAASIKSLMGGRPNFQLFGFASQRSFERWSRVSNADEDLGRAILNKEIKPSIAEKIVSDPIKYQRYLKWYGCQLDLMEYVDWTVRRQLHTLECPPKPLPTMRRIKSLQRDIGGNVFEKVETIIYLPDRST